MADGPLRVLVVDDSALYRQLVRNVLRDVPRVDVVGVAKTGEEALELVEELGPDLVTLDVRMPGLNGIEVLRELKRRRSRTKAVMLSSLTADGAQATTDALLEGAFDFIHKPVGPDAVANRKLLLSLLTEKIAAFREGQEGRAPRPPRTSPKAPEAIPSPAESASGAVQYLEPVAQPGVAYQAVVIGASTGGPVGLREVLPLLPGDLAAPVLVVQHMPPQYTHSLAKRLNEASQIEVVEACDGMTLEPGWAYIAPGGRQMKVVLRGSRYAIRITDDPPENSCRPAVDYLFRSAAGIFDGKVVAVVMTGMGRDGTEGCRELKRRGAHVIAQHPDGCVVYGMPKSIVDEKLADQIVPLEKIAAVVTRLVQPIRGTKS